MTYVPYDRRPFNSPLPRGLLAGDSAERATPVDASKAVFSMIPNSPELCDSPQVAEPPALNWQLATDYWQLSFLRHHRQEQERRKQAQVHNSLQHRRSPRP